MTELLIWGSNLVPSGPCRLVLFCTLGTQNSSATFTGHLLLHARWAGECSLIRPAGLTAAHRVLALCVAHEEGSLLPRKESDFPNSP